MSAICPNTDHDGVEVHVTRMIEAEHAAGGGRVTLRRCEYCAEGAVALMLRSGYRVTIWAIESVSGPTPNDDAGHESMV